MEEGSVYTCTTVRSEKWEGFGERAACVLGIDEAGRGPVLGPMVYGCAASPVDAADQLKALGVADSKALTEEKRDVIFDKMQKDPRTLQVVAYAYRALSPELISSAMLRPGKVSLNELSHNAAIDLIRDALSAKINVVEIFVDTVGPKGTYQAKLEKVFPGISITVREKADSVFPIVSAASIAAKVTRDALLKNWEYRESGLVVERPIGSGYPADPVTKKFLSTSVDPFFGFPSIVRFSWKTVDVILEKKAVPLTWEADEAEKKGGRSLQKLWANVVNGEKEKPTKSSFFTERKLVNATVF